jgi:hypothetical protein
VDGGLVAHGEFVVAAGYASVAFKAVDVALHGAALLVDVGVEGRPPFDPFLRRLSAWSTLIAMAALMPRRRRCSLLVFELYALSARTRSSRVRGRPLSVRGTRMRANTPTHDVCDTWLEPV